MNYPQDVKIKHNGYYFLNEKNLHDYESMIQQRKTDAATL